MVKQLAVMRVNHLQPPPTPGAVIGGKKLSL